MPQHRRKLGLHGWGIWVVEKIPHKSMGKGKGIVGPRFCFELRKNHYFICVLYNILFHIHQITPSCFTLPSISIPLNILFFYL